MTSEVDIVNNALIKIDGNTISQLGEEGVEGELSDILYPQIRDLVLRAHPWNFAIARASLTASSSSPAFEYTNQYELPSDCLRAIKLYDTRESWKVEGGKLLTDSAAAKLIYIKKVTDTGLFDPLFVDALATRLAAELSNSISGINSKSESLMREYKEKLQEAKTRDGQEGTPDPVVADSWVNSRNGDYTNWW